RLGCRLKTLLALAQPALDAPLLEKRARQLCQAVEGLPLRGSEMARLIVLDAQGAERKTARILQRHAGVEADFGIVDDQGIAAEAGVARRVGNFQKLITQNGARAKRDVATGLTQARQALVRFEPLP